MKKIAIQENLTNVKEYLCNAGYEVKVIDEKMKQNPSCLKDCDALVLNDLSKNAMGFENATTSCSTIDALGMTPEQIENLIKKIPSKK